MKKLTIQECIKYESFSNPLVPYISFGWGQALMARYLVWKTKRKYKRYEYIYGFANRMKNLKKEYEKM